MCTNIGSDETFSSLKLLALLVISLLAIIHFTAFFWSLSRVFMVLSGSPYSKVRR